MANDKLLVSIEVKLYKADGDQIAHTDREYTIKDLSQLPEIFENAHSTFALLTGGVDIARGYDEAA
jgi:hypothetical protein